MMITVGLPLLVNLQAVFNRGIAAAEAFPTVAFASAAEPPLVPRLSTDRSEFHDARTAEPSSESLCIAFHLAFRAADNVRICGV